MDQLLFILWACFCKVNCVQYYIVYKTQPSTSCTFFAYKLIVMCSTLLTKRIICTWNFTKNYFVPICIIWSKNNTWNFIDSLQDVTPFIVIFKEFKAALVDSGGNLDHIVCMWLWISELKVKWRMSYGNNFTYIINTISTNLKQLTIDNFTSVLWVQTAIYCKELVCTWIYPRSKLSEEIFCSSAIISNGSNLHFRDILLSICFGYQERTKCNMKATKPK